MEVGTEVEGPESACLRFDLGVLPPYRSRMNRRRFLLTSLAGAVGVPLAARLRQLITEMYGESR